MRLTTTACAVVAALATSGESHAMTCSIDSVTGVAFGNYDVFDAAALDSTGSITYQCSTVGPADTVVIDLSAGNGSYAARKMLQTVYELAYNLYREASRSTIWGDGTSGTGHYGPLQPAEATPTTVTIYGRIPALQNARAGSYADTVVATLTF